MKEVCFDKFEIIREYNRPLHYLVRLDTNYYLIKDIDLYFYIKDIKEVKQFNLGSHETRTCNVFNCSITLQNQCEFCFNLYPLYKHEVATILMNE